MGAPVRLIAPGKTKTAGCGRNRKVAATTLCAQTVSHASIPACHYCTDCDRHQRRRIRGTCLHPRHRAFARRSQYGLSGGHVDSPECVGERQRMSRRLDLVRCRLGGQSRLGVRQLPVLRLRQPAGAGTGIWSATRHRRSGVQHRRLLGPVLPGPPLVSAPKLLDASAAAAAPSTSAQTRLWRSSARRR
jgi:hypothetical protein